MHAGNVDLHFNYEQSQSGFPPIPLYHQASLEGGHVTLRARQNINWSESMPNKPVGEEGVRRGRR